MDLEIPKSQIRRIVKGALGCASESCKDATGTFPERLKRMQELHVNKDTVQAFSETTKIFIHFLTCMSNEVTRESKRSTISGEDVLKALHGMGLKEMEPRFHQKLEGERNGNAIRVLLLVSIEGD